VRKLSKRAEPGSRSRVARTGVSLEVKEGNPDW
jgi:hypothetical protein